MTEDSETADAPAVEAVPGQGEHGVDIHKPKAAHSWREFGIEIGTIICGILIALSLEQGVEWVHQRSELREAREALREELKANISAMKDAEQEDRCYRKALDQYGGWAKGGAKPDIPGLALMVPFDTVWETAKTGAVTHMNLKEKLGYAGVYALVPYLTTLDNVQRSEGLVVRGYLNSATVSPSDSASLLREVSSYQTLLTGKRNIEEQFVRQASKLIGESPPIDRKELPYLAELCGLAGMKVEPLP